MTERRLVQQLLQQARRGCSRQQTSAGARRRRRGLLLSQGCQTLARLQPNTSTTATINSNRSSSCMAATAQLPAPAGRGDNSSSDAVDGDAVVQRCWDSLPPGVVQEVIARLPYCDRFSVAALVSKVRHHLHPLCLACCA